MDIQNFDSYCKGLKSGDTRAFLLSYLRGWMIHVQSLDTGTDEEKHGYIGLTELLNAGAPQPGDEITRIVLSTREAFAHVTGQLHERILRENVMLPVYRVKEIDNTGLQWLSKRSGRTIREKLSNTNSMLAVRRRMSYDTGENRLLLAFTRQLEEAIEKKRTATSNIRYGKPLREEEKLFQLRALKFFRSEEAEDIGKWENVPPNNTLLSDRFYRQIWKGWKDLQNVSALIKSDNMHLAEHSCTFFLWNLLQSAKDYCCFLQQPVQYDAFDFTLKPVLGTIHGWNPDCGIFVADSNDRNGQWEAVVTFNHVIVEAAFNDQEIKLFIDGKTILQERLEYKYLNRAVSLAAQRLFHNVTSLSIPAAVPGKEDQTSEAMYMDIFAERPVCYSETGLKMRIPYRLMRQSFALDNEEEADVSDERATGLYLSNSAPSYTVAFCLRELKQRNQDARLSRLMRMVLPAIPNGTIQSVGLPLPDVYDEFQLGAVRKAVHSCYPGVHTMPKSIAVLFSEMKKNRYKGLKDGDFTLFVDYVSGHISLTLVEARYDETMKEALPETGGLVWERHPVKEEYTIEIKRKVQQILLQDGLQFSQVELDRITDTIDPSGISLEEGRAALFDSNERTWGMISPEMSQLIGTVKYDVTSSVVNLIQERQSILHGHNISVCLMSPYLRCTLDNVTRCDEPDDPLQGMAFYDELDADCRRYERKTGGKLPPLWTDHLPALAIKQMIGKFDLIYASGQPVAPLLGHEQDIPIPNVFTLPKGEKEYRFGLIMGQQDNISYEAVVRHPSFPLSKDTPCKLQLSYTYGRDIPYTLIFRPLTKDAGFHEAEVAWENAKELPYLNLPYPEYPEDHETWETLQHGKTRTDPDRDYLKWIENVLSNPTIIDLGQSAIQQNPLPLKDGEYGSVYLIQTTLDNGEEAIIKILDKDNKIAFDGEETDEVISCTIFPDYTNRYSVYLPKESWYPSKQGYRLFTKVENQGSVSFYENNIIFGQDVDDIEDNEISFRIATNRKGYKIAKDIVIMDEDYSFYFGKLLSDGEVPYKLEKLNVIYPLHQVFANGRTTRTPGCPEHFRLAMQQVAHDIGFKYILAAYRAQDDIMINRLFRVMSIMSMEIGKPFYDTAEFMLQKKIEVIDEDIGCGLGDGTKEEELRLLQEIDDSSMSDSLKIAIFSKAAWKNKGFIENAQSKFYAPVLLKYFDKAIDIVCKTSFTDKKLISDNQKKRILQSLEFILAVLRLRELGDDSICHRLSLNQPNMRELYRKVEQMATQGFELPESRLKLEVERSDGDRTISDFYYAVLTFITGTRNQIRISGIQESE